MKKVILMILSLAMVMSGMTAVSAEEKAIPASGYEFMDIAYNGNGTYVAMAKQNQAYTHLYYSTDGGITWTRSTDLGTSNTSDFTYVSAISTNPASQQQLVYWPAKNVFLAHSNKVTLMSSDGITWSPNTNVFWKADSLMAVSGEHLILAGGSASETAMEVTNDINNKLFTDNKFTVSSNKYYSKTVAAKPVDADGSIAVCVDGDSVVYDLSINNATGKYETDKKTVNYNVTPSTPYDSVYASGANQFLEVDGSENLTIINSSQSVKSCVVKEGANVTGVNASDKYIVVGMSDGTMYYTANSAITEDTVWTEISAKEGTTACSEPIKNIEFSDDSHFLALSSTQAYKASISSYCNVNEYVEEHFEIGTPEVSVRSSVFDGVRLIGGAYSPTLNKYVVYGDTAEVDEEGKYWGKIFISEDGINWRMVWQSYTFSYRNKNEDGSIRSYTEVRNGAVWWETQNMFMISASTMDHTGVVLTSKDGEQWTATAVGDTDFRTNTDIAVSGGKLYTTNNGRQFRTYTAWNKASMTYIGVTNVPDNWYMNQIAVSDDEDPAVLMAQNGNGAVRDNESTAEDELDKWKQISPIGGAGELTDAVYSKNLKKFVAVLNGGLRTSIVSKDGSVVQGPIVSGGIVCNAVDTNGTDFMFAGKDGNVYTAPDTAEFGTAKLKSIPAVSGISNTMNVTNVFKTSGNRFIATASDNTCSDVLVIDKNTNGEYGYVTANEAAGGTALEPGQTLNVKVNVVNQTSMEYNFDLITAVYSDGVLIQLQKNSESVPVQTTQDVSETVTLNDDLPADAVLRIFMWNSAEGMVPAAPVTTPF